MKANFDIVHLQSFFDFDKALQVMRFNNAKFGTRTFVIKKKTISEVPVFIVAKLQRNNRGKKTL